MIVIFIDSIKDLFLELKRYLRDIQSRRKLLKLSLVRIEKTADIPSKSVSIGKYTFIAKGVVLGPGLEKMGMFCSVAQDAIIGPNHHSMKMISTSSSIYKFKNTSNFIHAKSNKSSVAIKEAQNFKKTIIGNDVWIGARSIILSGVTVGDGAVIGAGAVVTKDVPAYGIVAGNPAKLIRFRFSLDLIHKLKKADIYSYPHEELFDVLTHFSKTDLCDDNIDLLINCLESKGNLSLS